VRRIHAARPDLRLVVPMAANVAGAVRAAVADWPGAPLLIDPAEDPDGAEKRAAFRAADAALAASGTVALELAAAGTPMVVAYDMGWLSRQIIGRLLLVDSVNLVNLVSETRSVPEFIGARCDPALIAAGFTALLEAPEAQQAAMAETMRQLGQGEEPPGLRAARAVLDGLAPERQPR
jgi:lipid-A-disaccharide synthase